MIATVEGDKLVSLRPDKDHPLSQGYACQKGIAYPEVQNDPDRVTHSLKRQPDGTFTRVSWDEAMGDIVDRLRRIKQERGGRVLVIDPRRTETANKFEWLPIVPDTDAWLLLSLLQLLYADGLADEAAVRRSATGGDALRELVRDFTPESTAERTGIPAEEVRTLAHELSAKKSAVYGRTGTCLGSSSTLVNFLMDAVNLVTGNLDVRGRAVFGQSPAPLLETLTHRLGLLSYGAERSRIGDFPDMLGSEPAANMAAEITTPGKGQIRALIVSAGNPVLSTPNGPALEEALGELDLMISLDLYVNETNAHADYVLPGTAMYEREDAPIFSMTFFSQPFFQVTEAVVPPAGEARPEWQVLDELARGLGTRAVPVGLGRLLVRGGELVRLPLTPRRLLDAVIRTGWRGDRFGLRPRGLSFATMSRKHPHGVVFAKEQPVGRLAKVVRHRGVPAEADRDARAALGLPVRFTEDIRAGVVAVPHGWGHQGTGGWRVANQNPGVNVNELASSDPADLEPLVGMTHLSGIPIRAEAAQPS